MPPYFNRKEIFIMFLDPIEYELDSMRFAGEMEEAKHDCENCRDRIGIPCLIARSCTKYKKKENETDGK